MLRAQLRGRGVEEEQSYAVASKLSEELMKEVVMAILQRGVSRAASVDQLDLANNHFRAGRLTANGALKQL